MLSCNATPATGVSGLYAGRFLNNFGESLLSKLLLSHDIKMYAVIVLRSC